MMALGGSDGRSCGGSSDVRVAVVGVDGGH
jgi:hypothetical protein